MQGNSTRDQLRIIIEKLGEPLPHELTGITNEIVTETMRRFGDEASAKSRAAGRDGGPIPLAEQFPGVSPLAIDLLARMLQFDQIKRCTVDVS